MATVRLMGVDPGGTTGIAIIDVPWDNDRFSPPPDVHLASLQIESSWGTGPQSVGWQMRDLIENYAPELIVVEKFVITQRTLRNSRQPDALWIIGGVRFLADILMLPVHMQASSLAKSTWDNARLKELGWLKTVKGDHARDALRHALTACATWKPPVSNT